MDCLKLTCLNLPKQTKGVLVHSGYQTVQDLLNASPSLNFFQLAHLEPPLSLEQADQLTTEIQKTLDTFKTLQEEQPLDFALSRSPAKTKREHISLLRDLSQTQEDDQSNFLDSVFGLGEVTELCGLSACGKTQVCFQLCLNAQVPFHLGGLQAADAQSLFIDCHGDFMVERVTEMAKNLRS